MPDLTTIFNKMEALLKFARLIEIAQDKKLITPDERNAYFTALNGKVHSEIEELLTLIEPPTP